METSVPHPHQRCKGLMAKVVTVKYRKIGNEDKLVILEKL